MNVLVLNSGSSSLKFQLIATDLDRIQRNEDARLLRGEVERIGGEAIVTLGKSNGAHQTKSLVTQSTNARSGQSPRQINAIAPMGPRIFPVNPTAASNPPRSGTRATSK